VTDGSPVRIVGITADDVTGATDSVVKFSRTGWSARLLLGELFPDAAAPGSALAVNSDARAMEANVARTATASAFADLVSIGANHLYLKIDSTMRGSVGAQIAGAVDAWQEQHPGAFAVVCPAYPAMGRTIEDGMLRVHGGPVEDSPAGHDPVTPVPTSDFSQLLPGTTTVTLSGSPEADAQTLRDAGSTGAVVVNAVSDDDLRALAAALVVVGPQAIPAGSAGLAAALATAWAGAGEDAVAPETEPAAQGQRIVVVVSSLHDVARAQTDHLCAQLDPSDLQILQPDESLLDQPNRLAQWAAGELELAETLPRVLVITSPEAVGGSTTLSGTAIASSLASVVQQTLARASVGALVLVGGDGARAVLDATRAQSLRITGAIQEGIPVGVVEGGTAVGKIVVTKAGGFGMVTALLDTVTALTHLLANSTEASS
jgi:uncharacterized protein YgbK (DUF1537 family)